MISLFLILARSLQWSSFRLLRLEMRSIFLPPGFTACQMGGYRSNHCCWGHLGGPKPAKVPLRVPIGFLIRDQ